MLQIHVQVDEVFMMWLKIDIEKNADRKYCHLVVVNGMSALNPILTFVGAGNTQIPVCLRLKLSIIFLVVLLQ